jgi:penicillin-binding protein 1A
VNEDLPGASGLSYEDPKYNGWLFKALFIIAVSGTLLFMVVAGAVFWHFSRGLPRIISVADYRPLGVTRILGSNGDENSELGEFFKERRYLIPYDKIPENIVRAFISAEDDRFFEHPGINILSIIRASIANFKAGHVVQGGSTITQQVAKSLLLTPERSFDRKIKEIILASRIERNLTKQNILYLYLNQIYLGHGAYGVQAASRTYFRKDISNITLAESALLAGMPQAPGKYSPLLNPKKAKERQLYVLRRMVENKYISQAQMTEAASQPLKVFHDEDLNGKYAPYFVEYIRKYLVEKYGEKAVYEDGLTVTVPATRELADVAKKSLREGLVTVDKRLGYRGPIQHLRDSEEIEKFLEDSRVQLIERKIHFQLFLPDGRIDPIEAMHFAGIQSDLELLEPNEMYQAVITGFDNKKKTARVMIGAVRGELSIERMRWARPVKDEKNPQAARPDPSMPSRIFKKGDVILVSLADPLPVMPAPVKDPKQKDSKDSKDAKLADASKDIQVALEQEPNIQGALFSMDAQNGHVLAMVGGYDFDQSEFNRASQAERQPGSAFKPIIYGSALEKGFTPASIIVDSPIVFRDSEGLGTWKPNNFEEKFYGDTTFRQALIHSRNIPTVKIVQAVQVPYLIQYAKRIGINAKFSADLSISLGSASITLMELTRTYALYPRLGKRATTVFLTKIVDRDGRVLEEPSSKSSSQFPNPISQPSHSMVANASARPAVMPTPVGSASPGTSKVFFPNVFFPNYPLPDDPDQVLDPRVAYVMTHLMKEVVNFGTGHEAKNLNRPAAGKTGTTNDSNDAWFMGFTPNVVTGVWVGFDSQKSIGPGETGARVALPIWLSFMKEAVKPYPMADFVVPPGVVFASIDATTGKLAAANSSSAIREAFIEGTQPTETSASEIKNSESQSDFFKEDKE